MVSTCKSTNFYSFSMFIFDLIFGCQESHEFATLFQLRFLIVSYIVLRDDNSILWVTHAPGMATIFGAKTQNWLRCCVSMSMIVIIIFVLFINKDCQLIVVLCNFYSCPVNPQSHTDSSRYSSSKSQSNIGIQKGQDPAAHHYLNTQASIHLQEG